MNSTKQKYIIENLISSSDIFGRCIAIIQSDYFDPEFKPVIKLLKEYYEKYNAVPDTRLLNSEFDTFDFKVHKITKDVFNKTCDDIELFCKESALKDAILHSVKDIHENNFGKVLERVQAALTVSLQRDIGVNLYDDPEEQLRALLDTQILHPTLITEIDHALGGGSGRQKLTLFSANSGGGKSIMLSNIGHNYSEQGYNVLYISLELSESMIYLRLSAIATGITAAIWKEKIGDISSILNEQKANGNGSYIVKRMHGGCTANDIRSYLKQYELELGYLPDVLLVDYLDLMLPNGGNKNLSVWQEDKLKSEQLYELLYVYDMMGFTASQQNREALRNASPDQGVIAGGISKVNAVDNYVSLYMDPAMRIRGEMMAYFLKTRSSSGAGTSALLNFNPENLQITGSKSKNSNAVMPSRKRKLYDDIISPPLESPPDIANSIVTLDDTDQLDSSQIVIKLQDNRNDLMNLMNAFMN